jgi:hypothetical protein
MAAVIQNQQNNNDSWKATGFVNVYVSRPDGSRTKLGAIPLRTADKRANELAQWLAKDEANVTKLQSSLVIDYKGADSTGPSFVPE